MPQKLPARVRLDRLLSRVTGLSRAQAQAEIRSGRVQVNGIAHLNPAQHVPADARLERAGRVLANPQLRYFMLNKPAGVVCANHDRRHRTVMDLLAVPNPAGLHVAGRLDLDATGLVLITDDGEWSHRLMSPRHKQPKIYGVSLSEPLTAVAAAALRAGVQLHGEPKRCAPAEVRLVTPTDIRLTLHEGKYHQVKRMLAAVGNHVLALHRLSIGAITLDPALVSGAWRPLTADEIAAGQRP